MCQANAGITRGTLDNRAIFRQSSISFSFFNSERLSILINGVLPIA
jgi:hypothetical protein